ncbi:ABC transporter substrate-binding protein [Streptomyces sp. KM273126]|uniref:ABC transporter substrate-binding protein n=1 Tax=Streptomyces sp. KM273126 TaxID=2545247 RepID=UPI00103F20DA|nr:ABC transporter substrate-binding protein [Streptomyces sp. KM273126]MBA2808916.1 ABC transporter substrate-binding protein [Streptomyces sp. KM273126]
MTAGKTRRTTALRTRTTAVGAIAVAGALLLTGCGDQTKDNGSGSGNDSDKTNTNSAPLADKLPADIRKAGVIKVGSDISYAPVEFKDDSGKTVGIDPDLADAMGKQLGVKFEFENGTFDTLLGGLRSKRYDIAMSAMTDTKARQEGIDSDTGKKVGEGVDFVDYFTAGVSIYTKKGDTQNITTWSDLCGKKLAVQRGTVSHDLAKAEAKKCPKDKTMSIEAFDNDQQAQTRLRSGGADAGSSDFPVAAYAVAKSGGGKDFELVGEQVEAAPYGIAIAKSNTELRDAVKAALDAVIANGEYGKIIEKWGVTDGAVKEATINGGK